jgi:Holliday junction resolvase
MMTHPSKVKGNAFEREVVQAFRDRAGWTAERAYASNGKALGKDETVDVLATFIFDDEHPQLAIQCKRRKAVAEWMQCNEHQDAVVYRADGKPAYIAMPLSVFLDLIERVRQ